MPYMNYEGLSKKINQMFGDLRIKDRALDEFEKSLKCHQHNVDRTQTNIQRYKRRCELLEKLLNKMPLDQKRIMMERNAHPNMKDTFYAERAGVSIKRYQEKAKEASKTLADLLAEVEGWEDL